MDFYSPTDGDEVVRRLHRAGVMADLRAEALAALASDARLAAHAEALARGTGALSGGGRGEGRLRELMDRVEGPLLAEAQRRYFELLTEAAPPGRRLAAEAARAYADVVAERAAAAAAEEDPAVVVKVEAAGVKVEAADVKVEADVKLEAPPPPPPPIG